ncbi:ArsR/SmtB family transcription factor [Kitasatospora sp. NPDC004615]|uniref:ArsR/SmtB family transcription factor n=1 Tax=Kitasatospora sp. NPDC004615 TaxID=3364017 RepID=UPI003678B089
MVMSVESDVNGTVDLLKALADPLRMRILTLLAHEALCTSHLVEETGAKQTNLSNHLKILREAGLVDTEPCGRFTYYKLRPDALEALTGLLGGLAATARATASADTKRSCP